MSPAPTAPGALMNASWSGSYGRAFTYTTTARCSVRPPPAAFATGAPPSATKCWLAASRRDTVRGMSITHIIVQARLAWAAAIALSLPAAGAPPAAGRSLPRAPIATTEPCATATGDARAVLERAVRAAGIPRAERRVLRYEFSDDISQNYQSDRTYPPFLTLQWGGMFYVDPASRVQRLEERGFGFGHHAERPFILLHGERATYVVRDSSLVPNAGGHALSLRSRPLDAWTVLADWRAAPDARVVARCIYRDYPRLVLERVTPAGPERLYVDPKSGLPVKLDRREPHYLWGDVHAEYVWTNWLLRDGVRVPVAGFRLVDGEVEIARTVGPIALVATDSAPSLALPADAPAMPVRTPPFPAPDTVRVGSSTFLLANRAYTNVVTLQRDTVWVLDAQLGEARAREDAQWIARLFPGRHPVALVVSDLAWPHIAGVRYWVARGATVYSQPSNEAFLRRVVDRRWTLEPDTLERVRRAHPAAARLRFHAVRDSLRLAGGAVTLHPIDGLGSEGALMAWIPAERFLWAGDYVQDVSEPTTYATEVVAAARRAGITPERVAAMHLKLTPWSTVVSVNDAAAEGSAVGATR
ncbi:MAG TPA: hypothetical protein VFS44_14200 [Gemmatimonadaceae bacterium]|nr:hypothetical protein [Gemmatimonadaceae bacterium]